MQKTARVFVRRDGGRAIVVAMHRNENGVYFEADQTAVQDAPLNDVEIGTTVFQALGSSSLQQKDLRDVKSTDWPAYRASGAPSVREFEADYIYLEVEGANDANLIYAITGSPNNGSDLEVRGTVSSACAPAGIGKMVMKVYRACRDRIL